MNLKLNVSEVLEAVAVFVSKKIGLPVTPAMVKVDLAYSGRCHEDQEAEFDGVTVQYPSTARNSATTLEDANQMYFELRDLVDPERQLDHDAMMLKARETLAKRNKK